MAPRDPLFLGAVPPDVPGTHPTGGSDNVMIGVGPLTRGKSLPQIVQNWTPRDDGFPTACKKLVVHGSPINIPFLPHHHLPGFAGLSRERAGLVRPSESTVTALAVKGGTVRKRSRDAMASRIPNTLKVTLRIVDEVCSIPRDAPSHGMRVQRREFEESPS